MQLISNQILRVIVFSFGVISLVLGVIGIFVPLLPTAPFILLSAWCFLKSSPRAYTWLRTRPRIGQPLRDWEESGSISRPNKVLAISMIAVSLVIIFINVKILWLKLVLLTILVSVSVFLVTRPEPNRN